MDDGIQSLLMLGNNGGFTALLAGRASADPRSVVIRALCKKDSKGSPRPTQATIQFSILKVKGDPTEVSVCRKFLSSELLLICAGRGLFWYPRASSRSGPSRRVHGIF
jgi:hypothetical protein